MNDIANDIRFVNKGGAERTYREANQEDARALIREIRQAVKWKLKSPPLLLVIDAATDADWPWDKWIKGLGVKRIELTELSSVKGLEFQWVVMVIGRQLYFELEHGFTGSSRRVYDARRLLRIPFSRARDAIYTLVVPDPRRSDGWDHFAPTESRGRWAI